MNATARGWARRSIKRHRGPQQRGYGVDVCAQHGRHFVEQHVADHAAAATGDGAEYHRPGRSQFVIVRLGRAGDGEQPETERIQPGQQPVGNGIDRLVGDDHGYDAHGDHREIVQRSQRGRWTLTEQEVSKDASPTAVTKPRTATPSRSRRAIAPAAAPYAAKTRVASRSVNHIRRSRTSRVHHECLDLKGTSDRSCGGSYQRCVANCAAAATNRRKICAWRSSAAGRVLRMPLQAEDHWSSSAASSTASTVPSLAHAVARRPVPIERNAWW